MSRHMLVGALVGAIAMVGCVSIEKTKMQMASADAEDVKAAEENIYKIATTGSIYPAGLMSLEKNERLEYISLSSNEELMKRIASNTDDEEIFRAAAAKFDTKANQEMLDQVADKTESITLFGAVLDTIDFKQPGVGMKYLDKVFGKKFKFYSDGRYSSSKSYWEWLSENEDKSRSSSYSWRRGYSEAVEEKKPEMPPTATLAAKLVSGMTEAELIKLLTDRKGAPWEGRAYLQNPKIDGAASVQLIRITQSPETLYRMLPCCSYGDKIRLGETYKGENLLPAVGKKLFMLANTITDSAMAEKIYAGLLESEWGSRWGKQSDMDVLLPKMSDDTILDHAIRCVNRQRSGQYGWGEGNTEQIEQAMRMVSFLKESANRLHLIKVIFAKVDEIKAGMKDFSWFKWGKADDARVEKLQEMLPELSEGEITTLALSGKCWQYVKDKVIEEAAYGILSSGKATSSGMEIALLERLPAEKVDVKVWESIKTETGKKAAYDAMTPENKQLVDKAIEDSIDSLLAKAKEASQTTMSLQGFYLGMDFKDAKALFAYYFPDEKIDEHIDGEGDNADYCFIASNQGYPFCYASVKTGKVWQFNFGRKVLSKWFQYDASRYEDWARAFSRENGIELKLDFLNRDDKLVVATGMSGIMPTYEEVYVTLHQTIWTYKSAAKHYRLTYFEEPEIKAYSGGILGEAAAAKKYRYISADAGTLRAVIEND